MREGAERERQRAERAEESLRGSICTSVYYCGELMYFSFYSVCEPIISSFHRKMYAFFLSPSLFLFFSFHLPSLFSPCKEIFADILSNGCLMSLWEELRAGMALRESEHDVISH